ncbi:MAG TPA: winged helix-turn-helix domain-containing protein [Myxococcota bacterium]|jgi:serine/threonine-protein kinase|nr:winged helix-turn-helix domain-containing protein [Myxococcota bacterium]
MVSVARGSLAFGPYRLEPDDRLLLQGRAVHLAPKEIAVLRALVEARGRVVSKDELFRGVWRGVIVSDASLTRCIGAIRAALGESGREGGYVETSHGRGYRFVAAVEEIAPDDPDDVRLDPRRVLVVPFENASRKPEDEYLCDGLTEELIHELGRRCAPDVAVIARHTSLACKGRDPTEAARALAAVFVVTGTLQRLDEKFRVRIELVRTSDLVQVWSTQLDRSLDAVTDLAAELAAALREHLLGRSDAGDPMRPARTAIAPRAHTAYLLARFHARTRTETGLRRALETLERAVSWDPGFALAYAAIAETHLMLAFRGFCPPPEAAPRVRAALDRAFALEPDLATAHTMLGYLRLQIEWDPDGASAALRRAREIEPQEPLAAMHTANVSLAFGRFEESIELRRSALELDPYSPTHRLGFGYTLLCAGSLDEALIEGRELARTEPTFAAGHGLRGLAALLLGDREEALVAAAAAEDVAAGDTLALSLAGWIYATSGRRAAADAVRAVLERTARERKVGASSVAVVHAGLGDEASALEWLERARDERDMFVPFVGVDPRIASLRELPRFRAVVRAGLGGRLPDALEASDAATPTAPRPPADG